MLVFSCFLNFSAKGLAHADHRKPREPGTLSGDQGHITQHGRLMTWNIPVDREMKYMYMLSKTLFCENCQI